jgi:hypothetical protein
MVQKELCNKDVVNWSLKLFKSLDMDLIFIGKWLKSLLPYNIFPFEIVLISFVDNTDRELIWC